jgi:nucleoside-diphosphate-sugar epimerase
VIWWWIQRILDGGPIVVPDNGPGHAFQITYVEDLADAFVAALGNRAAYRRAYNVVSPELLTAESWAAALGAPLGRSVECVRVPPPVIAAAGLSDYRVPIAGLPFGHVLMDTCRAQQELDFKATPLEHWARDTAEGCAASPPTHDSRHYAARAREIEVARAYARTRAATNAAVVELLRQSD